MDLVAGGPCMSECGMAALDLFARYKKLDVVSIGCYTPGWDEKVSKDKEGTSTLSVKAAASNGTSRSRWTCSDK